MREVHSDREKKDNNNDNKHQQTTNINIDEIVCLWERG